MATTIIDAGVNEGGNPFIKTDTGQVYYLDESEKESAIELGESLN